MLAALTLLKFLHTPGGSTSLSRIACKFRVRPGSGLKRFFEERFSFPNEHILFLRLFPPITDSSLSGYECFNLL